MEQSSQQKPSSVDSDYCQDGKRKSRQGNCPINPGVASNWSSLKHCRGQCSNYEAAGLPSEALSCCSFKEPICWYNHESSRKDTYTGWLWIWASWKFTIFASLHFVSITLSWYDRIQFDLDEIRAGSVILRRNYDGKKRSRNWNGKVVTLCFEYVPCLCLSALVSWERLNCGIEFLC